MLMNKSESMGRKRNRLVSLAGTDEAGMATAGKGAGAGGTSSSRQNGGTNDVHKEDDRIRDRKQGSGNRTGGVDGGGSGPGKAVEDVEMSVAKTGSAMREVAVASAPKDAAAAEIWTMLRERKRKKKEEVEEAFAGDYVPLNPLDWRARGR